MTAGASLEATIREIVRAAVREEVRSALAGGVAATPRNRMDAYLSIATAAHVADVAPGTIRAWIRAGRLPARRAGRVYRITRSDLDAFLQRSAEERGTIDAAAHARDLLGGTR